MLLSVDLKNHFHCSVLVDDSYKPDIPSYVNVAKEGEASSTSVGWGGVASRVKDGNTNGYWSG